MPESLSRASGANASSGRAFDVSIALVSHVSATSQRTAGDTYRTKAASLRIASPLFLALIAVFKSFRTSSGHDEKA